jgi:hypothetical protein
MAAMALRRMIPFWDQVRTHPGYEAATREIWE